MQSTPMNRQFPRSAAKHWLFLYRLCTPELITPILQVINGVKIGEGDGTVSLISLGAMCAEGWKRTRWNPAGINVTTIEVKYPSTIPQKAHSKNHPTASSPTRSWITSRWCKHVRTRRCAGFDGVEWNYRKSGYRCWCRDRGKLCFQYSRVLSEDAMGLIWGCIPCQWDFWGDFVTGGNIVFNCVAIFSTALK
jgi:hypothetical protein